jgi:predicted transcriptional regulator
MESKPAMEFNDESVYFIQSSGRRRPILINPKLRYTTRFMMQHTTKSRLARGLFLDRDAERFRQRLICFEPFLSRKQMPATSLVDFDQVTERLISEVFGNASDLSEAYEYAKLGEAASLVNLPEEAQESGVQDVERRSLQQRKQVLESCICTLHAHRVANPQREGRVAAYMSTKIHSIHVDATLAEAGTLLNKWRVGSLLVQSGSHYVGIITDTDLSRKAVAQCLDPSATTVNICMTKPVISIEDHQPMTAAISLMKEHEIRHLVVTAGDSVIGILSVSDVVRYYSDLVPLLSDVASLTDNGSV